MSTKTMKVGYRLVRNATSTADKAPYTGVAVPVGSLAYDNILQRMLDRGTFMTRATAQYFLNEFYEYAAKVIADDVVRINMGAFSIYPMIGGSFDSEDDAFRAPRNTLYVGATLSQEIRDAVAGITPASLGTEAANGAVKISSVMDLASETYRLIDGLNEFRIVGIDLTVPDGEDESLSLVASDGVTKVSDITVVRTDDGQRIVCTLASAVPAGTHYVRLVSHGLDPTAPLVTSLHKVSVKAATAPSEPAPTITGAGTRGDDPGEVNVAGATLDVTGEHLEGATAIELLNDVGEVWQTLPATYADGKLTAGLDFGEKPCDTGALRVTTAGGTATFPIRYAAH
ncbi:MAG: hypothetical protein K6G91_13420 [Kiritimatiellae bacterium]|nr:hypothetical protein [Kiritimatiellia bacterium]